MKRVEELKDFRSSDMGQECDPTKIIAFALNLGFCRSKYAFILLFELESCSKRLL